MTWIYTRGTQLFAQTLDKKNREKWKRLVIKTTIPMGQAPPLLLADIFKTI
jgi:hypothetical protein